MKYRYQPQITASAATIPTPSRHHLAHQIEETLDDRSLTNQLDETIHTTQEKLEEMQGSEQFLDTRIRKYRKMLAEHLMRINRECEDMNGVDKERHLDLQERYQLQICDVMDVHKEIVIQVETLRRKLKELEKKRDDLKYKREECEEFLIASAKLDLEDDGGGIGEGQGDVEMGALNRTTTETLELEIS